MDNTIPKISIPNEGNLILSVAATQAQVYTQGYTYNQAGFTFDQAGVAYGGVYNYDQDIASINLLFENAATIDLTFNDFYTRDINFFSIGPGFFMFITHI